LHIDGSRAADLVEAQVADYEWLGHCASEADGRMQIIQLGVP
jgi:hypothetical protein